MALQATMYDSDQEVLESYECAVDPSDLEVSIPTNSWTRLGAGSYWIVTLQEITETRSPIEGAPDEYSLMYGSLNLHGVLSVGD